MVSKISWEEEVPLNPDGNERSAQVGPQGSTNEGLVLVRGLWIRALLFIFGME